MNEENAFSGSGYYFYDLTTKVNYKLSDKNRLYLAAILEEMFLILLILTTALE